MSMELLKKDSRFTTLSPEGQSVTSAFIVEADEAVRKAQAEAKISKDAADAAKGALQGVQMELGKANAALKVAEAALTTANTEKVAAEAKLAEHAKLGVAREAQIVNERSVLEAKVRADISAAKASWDAEFDRLKAEADAAEQKAKQLRDQLTLTENRQRAAEKLTTEAEAKLVAKENELRSAHIRANSLTQRLDEASDAQAVLQAKHDELKVQLADKVKAEEAEDAAVAAKEASAGFLWWRKIHNRIGPVWDSVILAVLAVGGLLWWLLTPLPLEFTQATSWTLVGGQKVAVRNVGTESLKLTAVVYRNNAVVSKTAATVDSGGTVMLDWWSGKGLKTGDNIVVGAAGTPRTASVTVQ